LSSDCCRRSSGVLARKVLRLAQDSDDLPGQFPLAGVAKVSARSRVRLRQVILQLSSGPRLAFPAELTSMFALPAADVHVRRAISSHRFAEPASSSCTFRSPQPYATATGHETGSKQSYNSLCFMPTFVYSQGRLRPSLRRELFDFAPQVALAHSISLLP